jgi:hypothetical protein
MCAGIHDGAGHALHLRDDAHRHRPADLRGSAPSPRCLFLISHGSRLRTNDRFALEAAVRAPPEQFVLVDGWSLVAGSLVQSYGGWAARFASALASPPCYFALAVGIELLVGQHADQDDGSHHREVE